MSTTYLCGWCGRRHPVSDRACPRYGFARQPVQRLTAELVRRIDSWKTTIGYNAGICFIIEKARKRGVRQPRGCPFTTWQLGQYLARENRRATSTFYVSRTI